MSVLDKAKAHFTDRISTLSEIAVPEWGLTIYYKPVSLKAKADLNKYAGNPHEFAGMYLIRMALDEEGKRLFKDVNRIEIMRDVDPDVVERIVLEMVQEDSVEEAEKN